MTRALRVVAVAALATLMGCASAAPEQKPEAETAATDKVQPTSFAASDRATAELGVVRWERREERGERVHQSYLSGLDAAGAVKMLARIRVEHDGAGSPVALQVDQVTHAHGEGVVRFTIKDNAFTPERDDSTNRPELARILDLLHGDLISGASALRSARTGQASSSSFGPRSIRPRVCLTWNCGEMEEDCNKERHAVEGDCLDEVGACFDTAEPGKDCWAGYDLCTHGIRRGVECAFDAETPWGTLKCALGFGCRHDAVGQ